MLVVPPVLVGTVMVRVTEPTLLFPSVAATVEVPELAEVGIVT